MSCCVQQQQLKAWQFSTCRGPTMEADPKPNKPKRRHPAGKTGGPKPRLTKGQQQHRGSIGGGPRGEASRGAAAQPKSPKPSSWRKKRHPVKAKVALGGAPNKTSDGSKQRAALPHKKQRETAAAAQIWNVEVSKAEISRCQMVAWDGPVKLLLTDSEMTEAVEEILASGETHLGFDTETRPNFRKGGWNPTALVQLATSSMVYLFRICMLPGHRFDPLIPIFTNPNITKTGVSIQDDVKQLQKVHGFQAAGFVDTTTITKKVLRIKNGGLQALTCHFMNSRLSKAAQMSNWAAHKLTPKQILYAATDAWISREIHARAVSAAASSPSLQSMY